MNDENITNNSEEELSDNIITQYLLVLVMNNVYNQIT